MFREAELAVIPEASFVVTTGATGLVEKPFCDPSISVVLYLSLALNKYVALEVSAFTVSE